MFINKDTSHTFNAIKKYDAEYIIDFINEEFSEDEKISLLRNKEFIEMIPSKLLSLMLNNMSFISVFNMLQNKDLFDKVNNINVKLNAKDSLFINDCLNNSDLVNKLNHNMVKNMIINTSKNDAINLLNEHYIINKLSTDDYIEIAIIKKINLINEVPIINKLSKNEVIKYINGYWKNKLNYSLIDNEYIKRTIFSYSDINLEEPIYLYDYLTTKNNQNIKDTIHDLSAFKACVAINEIFGLQRALEIINTNKMDLDAIKNTFKEVDISKINNTSNLKIFIIMNIKDYLDNKYNLTINFGTIINYFKDEYINLSLKDIENTILNDLKINKNTISKEIINNDFNSDLLKINDSIEDKKTIDINNIKLPIDNNFIIKYNENLIECTNIDNIIYLDSDYEIDDEIINKISSKLIILDDIDYIILKSNKKDIKGIRLSSDNNKDEIVIMKDKPLYSNSFNNEFKKGMSR